MLPGKRYDLRNLKVTMMPGSAAGSFSGVLDSGKIAAGSWRC
jgi:hypothetical protein